MRKPIKVIEYDDVIDILNSAILSTDKRIENNRLKEQSPIEFDRNDVFSRGMKESLVALLKAFEEIV